MAQQQVNQILEAIKTGLSVRNERQRLAQQQEQIESEKKYREAETQKFQQDLAERKRQFDITSKAAQALHDVQIMRAEQEMTQGLRAGVPVPGEQVSGTTPSVIPEGMTQVPEGHQLHVLPTGHSVILPTPEKAAEIAANLARITNAPAEEAKTREQQKLQEAETSRQLKVGEQAHTARLEEERVRNQYELSRQANQIAAQRSLAQFNAGIQLRHAMITATGGLVGGQEFAPNGVTVTTDESGAPTIHKQDPADFVTNTIQQGATGQLSSDEIKKRYPKQAPIIFRMASEHGVGFLNKDQQTSLKDLETVAGVVPVIHEMNLIRQNYPIKDFIPGTDAYKKFQTDEDIVGRVQPALARIFSGTKRFNAVEMQKYWDALIPRRSPLTSSTTSGLSKYNDFVTKDIQDAFNTITSELPQGQRDIIRDKIGLNRLPYLSGAIKTPGQNPPTPQGATPALGTITVKRKSDGVRGTISLQDFDPSKYTKE